MDTRVMTILKGGVVNSSTKQRVKAMRVDDDMLTCAQMAAILIHTSQSRRSIPITPMSHQLPPIF